MERLDLARTKPPPPQPPNRPFCGLASLERTSGRSRGSELG